MVSEADCRVEERVENIPWKMSTNIVGIYYDQKNVMKMRTEKLLLSVITYCCGLNMYVSKAILTLDWKIYKNYTFSASKYIGTERDV